ncbi:limonene-1,2-epoxide hydrolase [Williamsia limnetica]|uniref:Limonene-1,2-epoxide hydrolase n=2 Tax=Williamsia limnetica TaxID=882452 RepID=A0A318RH60_WILLI|nr:limonene-1,2-epoxide hydrolase [Williamsia limnetica]
MSVVRQNAVPQNDLEKLSLEFFDAWSRSDVEELLAYFAPDAVYHNVPLEPLKGTGEIQTFLEGYFSAVHLEIVTPLLATVGSTVLSERIDILTVAGRPPFDLPVAGVMTFNDSGAISEWRDYFDLGAAERGTGMIF